jgi:hypothetical protein
MRKDEFIRAGEQLVGALDGTGVADALGRVAAHGGAPAALPDALLSDLLSALRAYGLEASRFTRAAREVAATLGLESLDRAEAWSRLISSPDRETEAAGLAERVRFAAGHLAPLLGLLDRVPRERAARAGGAATEVLTVHVIEAPNRFSTPARLAMLLQSLETLYEACAAIEGARTGGVSVVACDSGVDKTFDLLGDARAVGRMRDVLLSLWDRVVFHRALPPVERYKVASATLPVLDELRGRADAGEMPPEQAELLRRRLIESTGRFLVAGATIPDLREHAHANPRTLMAPAPKLIGPAVEGGE